MPKRSNHPARADTAVIGNRPGVLLPRPLTPLSLTVPGRVKARPEGSAIPSERSARAAAVFLSTPCTP